MAAQAFPIHTGDGDPGRRVCCVPGCCHIHRERFRVADGPGRGVQRAVVPGSDAPGGREPDGPDRSVAAVAKGQAVRVFVPRCLSGDPGRRGRDDIFRIRGTDAHPRGGGIAIHAVRGCDVSGDGSGGGDPGLQGTQLDSVAYHPEQIYVTISLPGSSGARAVREWAPTSWQDRSIRSAFARAIGGDSWSPSGTDASLRSNGSGPDRTVWLPGRPRRPGHAGLQGAALRPTRDWPDSNRPPPTLAPTVGGPCSPHTVTAAAVPRNDDR